MQSESFEIKRPWCNQDSTKKVSRFFTLAIKIHVKQGLLKNLHAPMIGTPFKLAIKRLKTCNCKIVIAVQLNLLYLYHCFKLLNWNQNAESRSDFFKIKDQHCISFNVTK